MKLSDGCQEKGIQGRKTMKNKNTEDLGKKVYIFREYTITEYTIKACSRKEAERKLYGDECIESAEWLEKTTMRRVL